MTVINPGGGGGSVTLSNQGLLPISPAMFPSGGAGATNLNVAEYTAFQVTASYVINQVVFVVGVQSGNVDVGVYDNTGTAGAPGTRLTHSGSTACPAAGAQGIAVPQVTLTPGKYYAALAADNGTATFNFVSVISMLDATHVRYNQNAAFPLPATATGVLGAFASTFAIMATHS